MKSKISFFNKTIFKKNITLYWPIWAGYLLALLAFQPFALWLNFENGRYYDVYTMEDKIQDLMYNYANFPIGWLIIFAAVIVGMALYSYIYNAKSANMIHALPVDKTQLFGTNVLSGLTFLILPQMLSALVSVGVCLGYGVNRLDVIGLALVETIAVAFVAYGIVTFCAMFTGLLVALPIYVFILNYLGMWVYYMLYLAVNIFAYGTSDLGSKVQTVFHTILAPLSSMGGYISLQENYENDVLVGLKIFGGELLLIYVAVAVVLYAIAYLTYKKRHIEQAGEWITVEWLKPVFRFGVGTSAGIYGGLFIYILLEQIPIRLNEIVLLLLILVLGGIGFFLAEMIVRKNFHVFHKKTWVRCGIFSVILLLGYGGMRMTADYAEKYVPEKEEVTEVSIHMGYDIELDGGMAERGIEIHKIILENLDAIQAKDEAYRDGTEPFQYFYIAYRLKNGEYVDRHYTLYGVNEEIQTIMNELTELEKDPEIFLQNQLCKKYKEVTVFGECQIEVAFAENVQKDKDGYLGYAYDTLVFTPEQTKELYEAVIADAQNGSLIKYNSTGDWTYEEIKEYANVNLYLRYLDPEDPEYVGLNLSENSVSSTVVDEEYMYQIMDSVYLSIGKDCENILNKLIEMGFIESVDDIYWGE